MQFANLVRISRKLIDLPDSRTKHFSFILLRNKVVSLGYNLTWKTTPLSNRYNYRFSNLHSEVAAIRNFPYPIFFLPKFRMVNVRIMANGEIGLSKPCDICQKLLKDFGVNELYYSKHGGDFGEL